MANVSSFLYRALVFSLGLWGISCTPDYLRPTLPGRPPIVTTLLHQNPAVLNCSIRLNAKIYDGEESLEEIGFLLSSTPNFAENGQGVQKVKCNISSLVSTNQGEQIFSSDYGVGSSNGVTRYYKAYGKNSIGIGYGQELSYLTTTQTSLATVTTTSVSSVTSNSATVEGYVTSDGGSNVTERGFAYGTSQNPTTFGLSTVNGSGIGVFTSSIAGLSPTTLYYVRAYATTSAGTAYGSQVSFTTSAIPTFTCGISTVSDVDNNTYNTVQIGTQCWTQSNLKVSKYRNGDSIPEILNNNIWTQYGSAGVGARCAYNNNSVNQSTYGILYNGYSTSDPRGLCPTGWNIPSETDWNKLVKFLDPLADTACVNIAWCFQGSVAGGMMKTSSGWNAPNTGANNSSQFSALPGGIRMPYGTFDVIGASANWWTQSSHTESLAAWRNVYHNHASVHRAIFDKAHGFSIRCIKNL